MSIATVAALVDALGDGHLLPPEQLADVQAQRGRFAAPHALARELLQRGWLTPYQVNQLLNGAGKQLHLGSYVLLERIGEGGMGEVFKARNWKLGQIVAVKRIRKERLSGPAVKRFQREARAAAQLSHPNVVRALDADQIGDTPVLVMEYVDGIDLARLVKEKGPLPVAQACDYVRQAALGLQHAHELGLVHRDIKPSNLLVTRDGVLKLLDMGLARFEETDEDATSLLTQEGEVIGTLDYLAPEQARDARSADIRSDLYSLGCTLHYLLTGQGPFPGGSATEKLLKHRLDPPPPLEKLRPDVPAHVAATVRKLLAKDPRDRFQTPAALAAALAGRGPALPFQLNRRRVLVGGAVLLGLCLVALVFALPSSKDRTGKATPSEPDKFITNSIGMKLAYIPPGKFLMGSTPEEIEVMRKEPHTWEPQGWDKMETPQHSVQFSHGFYLGVYEVTQGQFEQVMGRNPAGNRESPQHPVESISWDEAVEFCRKLSDLPEEKKARWVYRLPTEAEWEYACRGGTTTVFHFGNTLTSRQANVGGTPYGSGERGPRLGKTARGGTYPPNPWGLHDMHGNVWEWCLDGSRKYEKSDRAVESPMGEVGLGHRIIRGGGWDHASAWSCRSALRVGWSMSTRNPAVGFRVLCERAGNVHPVLHYEMEKHPDTAVPFNGRWYAFIPEKTKGWSEAQKRCQEMGGYLARIRSAEEQQFFLKLTRGQNAWLGGVSDGNAKWFWITGEPITGAYWAETQPNNGAGAFLQFMPAYQTSKGVLCWGDIGRGELPNYPAGFVCEWDF